MKPSEIVQAGPPATVIAATIYGMTLQDWASALAILLLMLQIAYFAWEKIIKPWRKRKADRLADAARRKRRRAVEAVVAMREGNGE